MKLTFFKKKHNFSKTTIVGSNVIISGNVQIGDYTYVSDFTILYNVKIGKFCSIANFCGVGMLDHNYKNVSSHYFLEKKKYGFLKDDKKIKDKNTQIGNDVWIGFNSIIKSGVKISDGAIVGAGSVVLKDVPAYAIVAGVPAKIIKYRFSEEIIQKLKIIKWWEWEFLKIKSRLDDFYNIENFIEKYYEK